MAYYSWKQKKAALKAAIAKALKLDVVDPLVELADGTFQGAASEAVQWENERFASRPTRGVWADLRLGSIVPIDQGETIYNYDEDTDQLLPTYGGYRRFTVMVIIGTENQEDFEAVGEVAGRLRTRILRPDIHASLIAVDIGYTSTGATMNVDFMDEGVMYSQSMTELTFETNEVDEPESGDVGHYIGYTEVTGELTGSVDDPLVVTVITDARPAP